MDNCLINPSGNPTGFQACDFFGEWVVCENQVNDAARLRSQKRTVFPGNIGLPHHHVPQRPKQDNEGNGAQMYGQHSHTVTSAVDISIIAERLLNKHVNSFRTGRTGATESEVQDLFSQGLASLGTGARIADYIQKMEIDYSMWADIPDNEDDQLPQEHDEEETELMEIQVGIEGGTRDMDWMDE